MNLRIKNFFIAFAMSTFAVLMVGQVESAPDAVGYVTRIQGEATVVTATERRVLALGHALHLGDRIVTGAAARLEARLQDGTVFTLGEHAEFTVQQVRGATPDSDGSTFELLKGVFRAVTTHTDSGQPQPSSPWQVKTPVATIGIRGTELWGGFNLLDAGSNTLDVVMLQGKGVYVESNGQRVELNQAGYGTTVKSADAAPTPSKAWAEKKLQAARQAVAW